MPKSNKLILCVDDHRDSLSFLVEWLQLKGYDVKSALSYDNAMGIVQANRVALSIVDFKLGGWSGIELCKGILATSPSTKVIIYSGDTSPGVERQALSAGASAFTAKPIDLYYLTALVEELIP